jgi:hypothetical protein
MKANQLSKGAILSESSFFTVKEVQTKAIIAVDDYGHELTISSEYVEQVMHSADLYNSTEQKNMTELAEIFINSPRVAQTVCFITKPKDKLKRDYEAEVQTAIDSVTNAKVADVPKLLLNLIENPISTTIPGEARIMRGRHYGQKEKEGLGRIDFIDMEIPKDSSKSYENRIRQVDPKTIQWLIVNDIKYVLKKK